MIEARIRYLVKTRLNKNGIYRGRCGDFCYICIGFNIACGNGRCDKQKQEWVNNDEYN